MRIVVLAAMAACLPDLDALPAEQAPPPANPCGDGVLGPGEECDPGEKPLNGCADCKIQCEGTRDPSTGHCYFRAQPHGPGFTPSFAQCFAADAHLVTIGDDSERKIADDLADKHAYWIGLQFEDSQGAYMPTSVLLQPGVETGWPQPPCNGPCTGCYGFGLEDGGFTLLDGAVPDFDAGAGSCRPPAACTASIDGRWAQVGCDDPGVPITTICEREPPGIAIQNCGSLPCFTLRGKNKLYSVHTDPVGAEQAVCEDGASLLHLDDDAERVELVRTLSQILSFQESALWIGLHFDAGTWIWDNGKPAAPHIWGDREPAAGATGRASIHLGFDYASGLVRSTTPTGVAGFICERGQ